MFAKWLVLSSAAGFLSGALSLGCVANSSDNDEDAVSSEGVTDDVAAAQLALTASCTTKNTGGGGTWGDIVRLCRTSSGSLSVDKYDGTSFTSAGTLTLINGASGVAGVANITPGVIAVGFGYKPAGWYQAKFVSNAPGQAWTAWLQN